MLLTIVTPSLLTDQDKRYLREESPQNATVDDCISLGYVTGTQGTRKFKEPPVYTPSYCL